MHEPRAPARDLFDEPLPTRNAPPRWRLPAGWRSLAGGRSGDALLAALVPGDPLALAQLARERARERALVLDNGEVLREAFAEIGAASSAPAPPAPTGPAWYAQRVDAALERVARRTPDPGVSRDLDRLAAPFGLAPCAARRIVHAHAHRGARERRAFRALLLDRSPLDAAAHATGEDAGSVARRVAATLTVLARAARAPDMADATDATDDTDDTVAAGATEATVTADVARIRERRERAMLVPDDGALAPFAAALGHRIEAARAALALLRVLDAARPASPTLEVAIGARRALECARLARAAAEALAHLLEPTLPADSHVTLRAACRTPRRTLAARLRALDPLARELGAALDPLASRSARVSSLLACLAALGAPDVELWRLRARYSVLPARTAAEEAAACGALPAEVAALWLDAGEPARAVADARGPAALLARAALDLRAPCAHGGPARLHERRTTPRTRDPLSAAAHGASVLSVRRLTGGVAELVHLDLSDLSAPGAPGVPGVPATGGVRTDGPIGAAVAPDGRAGALPALADAELDPLERDVWRTAAGGVARLEVGGLDPAARWAAVEPVLGPSGEAVALVRLEWRHGALTTPAARAALASTWAARLGVLHDPLPRLVEHGTQGRAAEPGERRARVGAAVLVAPGPLATAAHEAVEALAVGLAQRRWLLLTVRRVTRARSSGPVEIALERVAEGGGAALAPRSVGEARGVALALAAGLPVDVGRDPARLAAHASLAAGPTASSSTAAAPGDAPRPGSTPTSSAAPASMPAPASGVVVPVGPRHGRGLAATLARGEATFVLVLESPRRGDLGPRDAARLALRLAALAPALDLADLEQRERRAGGPGLDRDARDPCHADLARAVRRAARGPGAAVVCGPSGAGRAAVARWVEHVRARRRAALPGTEVEASLAGARAHDTRLLDAHPRELAARGVLDGSEAARLSTRAVVLPAAADARHRLPGQVQRRLPPGVEVDEAALATLWRATWPAGVHDLEATLARLIDDRPDRATPVTAEDVCAGLGALGLTPAERLPSRAPALRDLAAALWCTRTAGGRANKTRAAAWLGWDPETLRARLRDTELDGVPAAARVLAEPPAPSP